MKTIAAFLVLVAACFGNIVNLANDAFVAGDPRHLAGSRTVTNATTNSISLAAFTVKSMLLVNDGLNDVTFCLNAVTNSAFTLKAGEIFYDQRVYFTNLFVVNLTATNVNYRFWITGK